jgi:hypothetical protein
MRVIPLAACLMMIPPTSSVAAANPGSCGAGGAGCQPAAVRAFTTIAVRHFPDATSQFWQSYGYGCARAGKDIQTICRVSPDKAARRLGLD